MHRCILQPQCNAFIIMNTTSTSRLPVCPQTYIGIKGNPSLRNHVSQHRHDMGYLLMHLKGTHVPL
jgi:hypothetical protein